MASTRALNYIFRRHSIIVPSTFYYFCISSNIKRNIWFSAKKPAIKFVPKTETKLDFRSRKTARGHKIIFSGLLLLTIVSLVAMYNSVRQMRNKSQK